MSVLLNKRGATLPLTILVIALMGVAVAISYSRLSSERRITGDGQAQMDAFNVAQSGLSTYLAGINGKPGASEDVTVNGLPGGTAQVSLRMLRESTTTLLPAVYVITSRGTNTTARRYDGAAPPAERTVATYALWTPAAFDLDAAITSLGGMDKAGGSGTMSGVDACGMMPTIGGVAVPINTYTGATGPIDGNPDNTPIPLGTAGPTGSAKDEVDIDWAGIVDGTVLPPEFTYPSWPTAGEFLDWPVVRVNNNPGADFDLPGSGKGILIVTGNVILSGSKTWEGVIIAGGSIRSNGSNSTRGAVIAGLNVKLGQTVSVSEMNGTKSYQYDSCALTRALGHIGSLQRVRNGWTDTWSSY
ncbi:MAG: type II secretion system protein [Gemmatimonadales bacterium]